jgi:hypothetical protein
MPPNYNIYGISFHIPPLCLNLAAMRLNVCTLNHGQVFIVGNETLRAVAFFAAAMFTQTFDNVMLPPNTHVLGTPNRNG